MLDARSDCETQPATFPPPNNKDGLQLQPAIRHRVVTVITTGGNIVLLLELLLLRPMHHTPTLTLATTLY